MPGPSCQALNATSAMRKIRMMQISYSQFHVNSKPMTPKGPDTPARSPKTVIQSVLKCGERGR